MAAIRVEKCGLRQAGRHAVAATVRTTIDKNLSEMLVPCFIAFGISPFDELTRIGVTCSILARTVCAQRTKPIQE